MEHSSIQILNSETECCCMYKRLWKTRPVPRVYPSTMPEKMRLFRKITLTSNLLWRLGLGVRVTRVSAKKQLEVGLIMQVWHIIMSKGIYCLPAIRINSIPGTEGRGSQGGRNEPEEAWLSLRCHGDLTVRLRVPVAQVWSSLCRCHPVFP